MLVGDPRQLPATVLSRTAIAMGYSRSLFARLMDAGYPTVLMDTQYRSHADVSAFPSKYFYEGRVKDDDSVLSTRSQAFHDLPYFKPLLFFNVTGREDKSHRSYRNKWEAAFIVRLCKELNAWRHSDASGGRIKVRAYGSPSHTATVVCAHCGCGRGCVRVRARSVLWERRHHHPVP